MTPWCSHSTLTARYALRRYAYQYQCERVVKHTCLIRPVPFRGCPCSDAAGREIDYADVVRRACLLLLCHYLATLPCPLQLTQKMLHAVLRTSTTGRLWDEQSGSPYFSFVDNDGTINQVRYDDPDSLRLKFGMAAELGLRGVGVWHLDALPSGPDAADQRLKVAMWRAFEAFTQQAALACLE